MAGQPQSKTYGFDPENDESDAVRLLIGDTDPPTMQLYDSEIRYHLSAEGGVRCAAAAAAMSIAAKYAAQVDCATGSMRRSLSQRQKHFLDLAKRLRADADLYAAPTAGGLSRAEKITDSQDSDLLPPQFSIGMHDHEGATSDDDVDDLLGLP